MAGNTIKNQEELTENAFLLPEDKMKMLTGECPKHMTKQKLKEWLSFRKGTAKDGSAATSSSKKELFHR